MNTATTCQLCGGAMPPDLRGTHAANPKRYCSTVCQRAAAEHRKPRAPDMNAIHSTAIHLAPVRYALPEIASLFAAPFPTSRLCRHCGKRYPVDSGTTGGFCKTACAERHEADGKWTTVASYPL